MKKKVIAMLSMIVMLLSTVSVHAQSPNNFIENNEEMAIKIAKEYDIFPSVMMAQAIVESGFGRSLLASKYNNYFGMKGQGVYMDSDSYQVFSSPEDSFRGYAKNFYRNSNIYAEFLRANDPKTAVRALNGIYSTNNSYSVQVIQIMDEYNLYELDDRVKQLKIIEEENKRIVDEYKENLLIVNNNIKRIAKKLLNKSQSSKEDDAIFKLLPCIVKYGVDDISRIYGISNEYATSLLKKYLLSNENIIFDEENVDSYKFNQFLLNNL